MAVSESQRLAVIKYRQEKRDQIAVDVPKGKREEYKLKAAKLGLSLSMLIQHGVESYGEEFIANHSTESFTKPEKPESLSADERRMLVEFNQLPSDAQKHLLKFVKAVNHTKGGGEND